MNPREFLNQVERSLDEVVSAGSLVYCGSDIKTSGSVKVLQVKWNVRESTLVARTGRSAVLTTVERRRPVFVQWQLERNYVLPKSIDGAVAETGYLGTLHVPAPCAPLRF